MRLSGFCDDTGNIARIPPCGQASRAGFPSFSASGEWRENAFSDKNQRGNKIVTLDMAKRLMDYGFYPPTVYFPLVVNGAIMVEPTETEPKENLDLFVDVMKKIAEEAEKDPELLRNAPHRCKVRRLDEVSAARNPCLKD